MNAEQRIAKIIETIESGKTVYVYTSLRVVKVTPKTFKKFADSGRPLFKAAKDSMWMSFGNRYDCIDFCKFTVSN